MCSSDLTGKYAKMYPGTAAEAAKADEKDFYPAVLVDGNDTFTVPVAELDKELPIAGFSVKNQSWGDKTFIFLSEGMEKVSDLPEKQ